MNHPLARLQQAFDEEAAARTAVARLRRKMNPLTLGLSKGDLAWSLYWAALAFVCVAVAAPALPA